MWIQNWIHLESQFFVLLGYLQNKGRRFYPNRIKYARVCWEAALSFWRFIFRFRTRDWQRLGFFNHEVLSSSLDSSHFVHIIWGWRGNGKWIFLHNFKVCFFSLFFFLNKSFKSLSKYSLKVIEKDTNIGRDAKSSWLNQPNHRILGRVLE